LWNEELSQELDSDIFETDYQPAHPPVVVVVVLPDPFRGMGAWRNSTETQQSGLKAWTRGQKWKKYCQRWRAGEAQMRDNPEGGDRMPSPDRLVS